MPIGISPRWLCLIRGRREWARRVDRRSPPALPNRPENRLPCKVFRGKSLQASPNLRKQCGSPSHYLLPYSLFSPFGYLLPTFVGSNVRSP